MPFIAMVFDMGDTLTDDTSTAFLQSRSIEPSEFWSQTVQPLIQDGWEPPPAYMHSFLELTQAGQPLAGLTKQDLQDFGKTITFYKGIPALFGELQAFIEEEFPNSGMILEYYIVSGGFEEIIRGSTVSSYCRDLWGCEFGEDPTGRLRGVKRVVSFTEKTRYLYQINKGIVGPEYRNQPAAVNEYRSEEQRRIPFNRMIYVGDGLTDIPCFSMLRANGGYPFAVFDPTAGPQERHLKPWALVRTRRVLSMNEPRYQQGTALRALLENALWEICSRTATSNV